MKMKKKEDKRELEPNNRSGLKMKRSIGWLTGSNIIISSMIGSGIFISPQGVITKSGSVGASLLVWLGAGILATFGAMCYAEVGAMIPKSGGEFPIIKEAYGAYPAFLFAWTSCIVLRPSALAILSITFAKYFLAPFFSIGCPPPPVAEKLTAIAIILIVVYINCSSVKLSTGFLNVFSVGKLISLVIIVCGGVYMLVSGNTDSFSDPFSKIQPDSTLGPQELVLAFYQGLWAYDGWNQLNCILEELKEPEKSLPKSIGAAMVVVTSLYLLTNVAYLSAMSPIELIDSVAVGFTFGEEVLGVMKWIIPVAVSWSVLGAGLGSCFAAGRISFVAARDREFPQILSMIHIKNLTPAPAVILNGLLGILMVIPNDFNSLVGYFSFCMWIFHFGTCSALLYFRYQRPNAHRPIKVNIIFPVVVCLSALCLIFVPLFDNPKIEYLYAALFVFSGTFFYFPLYYKRVSVGSFDKLNNFLQRLMLVAASEK